MRADTRSSPSPRPWSLVSRIRRLFAGAALGVTAMAATSVLFIDRAVERELEALVTEELGELHGLFRGSENGVEEFDDFAPDKVAMQIEPLRELLEKRRQLADLKGKLASNYKLDQMLQDALGDEEKMAKLKAELEAAGGDDGES